jgi:hypothetical protein
MARIKICPVCRTKNDAREPFCTGREHSGRECNTPLADVTAHDGAQGTHELGEGGHVGTTVEPAAGLQAAIEFSWGRAEIESRLGVGRDAEFSAIAGNLGEFVSRRHAELFFEGGGLFVCHLGQTNPTYLNGRKLGDGERARLNDGDVVGFSTQEKGVVRIKARQ